LARSFLSDNAKDGLQKQQFSFHPTGGLLVVCRDISDILPALSYLESRRSHLGLKRIRSFSGLQASLRCFGQRSDLLTFLATAMGLFGGDISSKADVMQFVLEHDHHLVAISLGAVFFGAMTYIGNGPNFMVKSIADREKIKMPTFFGYIFKYSIPFLIHIFLLVSLIFFSRWSIF
jgi:hypothetical protein